MRSETQYRLKQSAPEAAGSTTSCRPARRACRRLLRPLNPVVADAPLRSVGAASGRRVADDPRGGGFEPHV